MLCSIGLMACSTTPKQIIKTEYIYQQVPPLPEKPKFLSVEWVKTGEGMYCIDAENAKRLLINITLQQEHEEEMKKILEGLKTDVKPEYPR